MENKGKTREVASVGEIGCDVGLPSHSCPSVMSHKFRNELFS